LERNARDAWRHHIKVRASDEWCERYYKALGRPWSNPRLSSSEQWRLRYRADERFNLNERMRAAQRKQAKLARTGELVRTALSKQKRSITMEKRLGYSLTELRDHLERQFTRGMTWDRFMDGDIHIDHITPKSLFDITDEEQYLACWCLSNLRPMWAADNIAKGRNKQFLI
jgi:hypothetical protein